MKAKLVMLALLMAATLPAAATENPVNDLAQISGLSERKVRMIVGNRTAFAEYPYTYQRSLEKLVDAIGEGNYQQLMQGRSVAIVDRNGQRHVVQLRPQDLSGSP